MRRARARASEKPTTARSVSGGGVVSGKEKNIFPTRRLLGIGDGGIEARVKIFCGPHSIRAVRGHREAAAKPAPCGLAVPVQVLREIHISLSASPSPRLTLTRKG